MSSEIHALLPHTSSDSPIIQVLPEIAGDSTTLALVIVGLSATIFSGNINSTVINADDGVRNIAAFPEKVDSIQQLTNLSSQDSKALASTAPVENEDNLNFL